MHALNANAVKYLMAAYRHIGRIDHIRFGFLNSQPACGHNVIATNGMETTE